MSQLRVWDTNVQGVLQSLRSLEWQVPLFQREFVWSVADVVALAQSIVAARPIGMATIWAQADQTDLELGPIWLADGQGEAIEFRATESAPNKTFAILDGRQRATAIAMIFGGFRQEDGRRRFSGRFFLDLKARNQYEQITYLSKRELERQGLSSTAACVAHGLVPLAVDPGNEERFTQQWLGYVEALTNPEYYADGELPDSEELARRRDVLWNAYEGIINTKLAVYEVPQTYDLAQICDIFETLNTTGTKVSTVDLIHSWLYADTKDAAEGPLLLRDQIDDLGALEGAYGWAKSDDRPELTVQVSTASYVALDSKAPPRRVGRRTTPEKISSVKAGDLLATPSEHWKTFLGQSERVAGFWGDFQKLVGGGYFPWRACPYPVSSAIYVALRYKAFLEDDPQWGIADLDAVYRAFFWRNALARRYDQGFLTQLGTDLREILKILRTRSDASSPSAWAAEADRGLANLIDEPDLPSTDDLRVYLTDGRPGGALDKALTLRMTARAACDVLNPGRSLRYPSTETVELHHIYPRAWCRTNQVGALADILDPKKAAKDWPNSISNLMPLSRTSNKQWKAKPPGQALAEKSVTYASMKDVLQPAYIDETAFDLLLSGALPTEFWEHRSQLMADDLVGQMIVRF